MGIVLIAAFFIFMCIGRYAITPPDIVKILFEHFTGAPSSYEVMMVNVVMQVRLPRILLSIIIGAGLAASGASYQCLFGNPLVSPDILGVSAGAGFLKWKRGTNYLNDEPITSYTDSAFWKITSYVPQARQSVFAYKVVDTVLMGLNSRQNFFAIPSAEDYDKAYAMLEELGVRDLSDKFCNELSGGELQMVMIARALISEPELMILDEPESNLDMKNQLRVIDTIEQIAERYQTSCLINTHFPDHALKISDRTLMLGFNNEKLYGKTDEIVTEENIRKYFKVRSKIVSFNIEERSYHTIFPYRIAE